MERLQRSHPRGGDWTPSVVTLGYGWSAFSALARAETIAHPAWLRWAIDQAPSALEPHSMAFSLPLPLPYSRSFASGRRSQGCFGGVGFIRGSNAVPSSSPFVVSLPPPVLCVSPSLRETGRFTVSRPCPSFTLQPERLVALYASCRRCFLYPRSFAFIRGSRPFSSRRSVQTALVSLEWNPRPIRIKGYGDPPALRRRASPFFHLAGRDFRPM